jgi:hypothetical protein
MISRRRNLDPDAGVLRALTRSLCMTPTNARPVLACLLAAASLATVLAACSVRTEERVVSPPPPPVQPTTVYVPAPAPPPPVQPDTVSPSRDEYGFRYDAKGNRIDRYGNIISPHSTTP